VRCSDLPEKYRGQHAGDEVRDMGLLALMEGSAPYVADEDMHLDASGLLPMEGLDLKDHLTVIEVGLIRQALEATGGVVAHAARLLHMQRTTLVEKLRKYGLQGSMAA
ncbi:MAG TPA: helix-turn-helix domain-containing protein, partial [Rhodanobacter sp.]|nr:helix-turn-helix domain-containing protein [Rhodanobacter sp.]